MNYKEFLAFDVDAFLASADGWDSDADNAEEFHSDIETGIRNRIWTADSEESWTGAASADATLLFDLLSGRFGRCSNQSRAMASLVREIGDRWKGCHDQIKGAIEDIESYGLIFDGEYVTHPQITPNGNQSYEHLSATIEKWEESTGRDYAATCTEYVEIIADCLAQAEEADEDFRLVLVEEFTSSDPKNDDFFSSPEANPEVVEATIAAAMFDDGELSDKEVEELNEMLAENEGDPAFATTLMEKVGGDTLVTIVNQTAFTSEDGDPQVQDLYEGLGIALATATDKDNEPHVSDEWIDDLMAEGSENHIVSVGDQGQAVGLTGYQLLAPLLRHGEYDPDFIVPVTQHMMALDSELQSDNFEESWSVGADSLPGDIPNFDEKIAINPLNAGLLAVDHNPEAAIQLFNKTGEVIEVDGEEIRCPDPLEYVLDNATDTDYSAETEYRGTDYSRYDGVNGDIAGGAIEAACTGLPSNTDYSTADTIPSHTTEMTNVTERLIEHVAANPEDFGGKDARASSMVDNFADITSNYSSDFYGAYVDDSSQDADWMPPINGEPLNLERHGNVGQISSTDEWMQVLGHDEAAMSQVLGSMEATAAFSVAQCDDDLSVTAAVSAYGSVAGEMSQGQLEAIRDGNLVESQSDLKHQASKAAQGALRWLGEKTPVPVLDKVIKWGGPALVEWLVGSHDQKLADEILSEQSSSAVETQEAVAIMTEDWLDAALEQSDLDLSESEKSIVIGQMKMAFSEAVQGAPNSVK
ncbi:hypothetical protein [Stackebrandtia soli]|uniref:hypothetical protein n=1 Tax=Stackebrandtia soli TaxID=1892856 RepID=UPI0039ED25AD